MGIYQVFKTVAESHIEELDLARHPEPGSLTNVAEVWVTQHQELRNMDFHPLPERRLIIHLWGEVEIGFGDGNLLFNLTRKCQSVVGVDLAEPRVRTVSDLIEEHGKSDVISVEQADSGPGLLERFRANSFDCVAWTDVMEHIVDIHETMRFVRELVKPESRSITPTLSID